jgi:hypothetical protein
MPRGLYGSLGSKNAIQVIRYIIGRSISELRPMRSLKVIKFKLTAEY